MGSWQVAEWPRKGQRLAAASRHGEAVSRVPRARRRVTGPRAPKRGEQRDTLQTEAPTRRPFRHSAITLSGEVRHHIRREYLSALVVTPSISVDQHIDTDIPILPNQIDGLGHGAEKPA